jgi:DNA-binding transcriptional MerR regulator
MLAIPNLKAIPDKRYFSIGEVSELCDVKPHVLRYWEQEFKQLHPLKRRGNRRYYQQKDVELVKQIRHLLYEQGFTISGAKQKLALIQPITANEVDENAHPLIKELHGLLEVLEEG